MIIEKLKLIQGKQSDQQFAKRLNIHRVSWQRIKNRRVPISDKFLIRVHRAFPELKTAIDIFLSNNGTLNNNKVTTQDINHNASQTTQDGKIARFKTWLGGVVLRAKKIWHNSREP